MPPVSSLPPNYRHTRPTEQGAVAIGNESQRFMAKPCTPHPIAQRVQSFKLKSCNVNFLWVGVREG